MPAVAPPAKSLSLAPTATPRPSKGDHLKKLFAQYGDKFELVVVEDITSPRYDYDLFASASEMRIDGIDIMIVMNDCLLCRSLRRLAHLRAITKLIVPTTKGTVSIPECTKKYSSSVKRIVVTSSCAAVVKPSVTPAVWDETSWNEPSIEEVKEKGRNAQLPAMYCASKTLTEKAAWEFVEKNKWSIGWDLKERLKSFLVDTDKMPEELIFIGRNMRIMQGNNQMLGSPVNHIKITGFSASTAHTRAPHLTLVQRISRAKQWLHALWSREEGLRLEDELEKSVREIAKNFGVEMDWTMFAG
ncbi:hypothetical protein EW146_g8234 [Bondarzewia mesenterica]|uniref:NAD-dependent epimerase/dehydratase domain-containing protein n=1 Tax=Bondarzewia mesenterica TaxID=1095465 RepID=A0A4S4LG10_9AGAM|nr:hypothetical protein EW146_g8234 [Bondarzewia mesenterica]